MQEINWTALTVFVLLFGFITWLGFAAAHWRKGDLDQLHEAGELLRQLFSLEDELPRHVGVASSLSTSEAMFFFFVYA